jgi:peptidoglycan/xylan/chitin deacetylase (PgdA/CDA1 family)
MNLHDYVPYRTSSLPKRAPLQWPDGCKVAVCIVVSAEYYEMQPPTGSFVPPNLPGGFGRAPYPDVRAFSQREYGNRVGIFRVMEALDRQAIKATVALDASIASRYPYLVAEFKRRDYELAAHGFSLTRVISSHLSEDEERAYIHNVLELIEKATGTRPAGWHGPEYGESECTVALLAELGLSYVLDWPNDEQPYAMSGPTRSIISLPMALELDDVVAHYHRRIPMARWVRAVRDAVDQLVADSATTGRHLVLNLHPWLIGQPHRISYLEEVLAALAARDGLWIATAGQIVSHYQAQMLKADG